MQVIYALETMHEEFGRMAGVNINEIFRAYGNFIMGLAE